MSEAWKKDSAPEDWGATPKFGRRAREWFYRRLHEKLTDLIVKHWGYDSAPRDEALDRACAWYVEREIDSVNCVLWVNAEKFQGGRYASGHHESTGCKWRENGRSIARTSTERGTRNATRRSMRGSRRIGRGRSRFAA